MPVAFSRTIRSVDADKSRITIFGVTLLGAMAAIWVFWMLHARVSVYAVSDAARLEADGAVRQVQTVQAGRIIRMHMALGQRVTAGDVLAELDTTVQRMEAQEERSDGMASAAELQRVQQELASEQSSVEHETQAASIALDESRTKLREAETTAAYAVMEAEHKVKLHDAGLAPELEVARATAEADKAKSVVEGLRLGIRRQEEEQKAQTSDHRSRIDALLREATRLAGAQRKSGLQMNRLQTEMALQRVVAPVSGVIGELASWRVGSVIGAGEQLAAIVPAGKLKIVAQFKPVTAVGRVRTGQLARVRFEGFPWPQYGTMSARVTRVANELREGYVQVDLEPLPGSRIPLQHGLPGATEVEIEHVSPAALMLRSAGEMMKSHKPEQTQTAEAPGVPANQPR